MKPPPLLMGAALLFWGWQTGFIIPAMLMAGAVESVRWLKVRWELSDDDVSRIWTFCSILFLAAIVYAFASNDGISNFAGLFQDPNVSAQRLAGDTSSRTAATMIRWLPMFLFIFVMAQSFNAREAVPLATISLIFRRRLKKARDKRETPPSMSTGQVQYSFFAICLCAACASTTRYQTFFVGFSALVIWALWPHRSRRYAIQWWAGALIAALVLGYGTQRGMLQLQRLINNFNPQWLSQFSQRGFDPERTRTALGSVGEIKLSGRIVIRLQTPEAQAPPDLLREASYREFHSLSWLAGGTNNDFRYLGSENDGTSWNLLPGKPSFSTVNIACALPGKRALLPLPTGSSRLEQLPDFVILSRNDNGTVLAEQAGFVIFDAQYGPGKTIDSPGNTNIDLHVPEREQPALQTVLNELELAGDSREDKLRALSRFFGSKFSYSLWQRASLKGGTLKTPLTRFLLETRSGHCEYFATATVLLLRSLEIPARYAVGYAVHEGGDGSYVVRQRDAHAWCLVWNEDSQTWENFDTTPASWIAEESRRASMFQWLSDGWSRLKFEIAKLRLGQTNLRRYLFWALIPVLAFLLYRIVFRKRKRRRDPARSAAGANQNQPGLDSEFYRLERRLTELGFERQPGETLAHWIERVVARDSTRAIQETLRTVLHLHYQLRFDPMGVSDQHRADLRHAVRSCLTELEG